MTTPVLRFTPRRMLVNRTPLPLFFRLRNLADFTQGATTA
ncbi:MAG: hypothetical protein RL223_4816, partial [Pseudomonadota bacterium]